MTIIEGVIFVVCVLTFRRGIVGVIAPYVIGRPRPPADPLAEPATPLERPIAGKTPEVAASTR